MELELSLGDSPARVKATVTPTPVPTCAAEGEDHDDLVLGLGVRAAKRDEQNHQATKRDEQNNQRTTESHQEEAMEGEDDDKSCRALGEPLVEVSLSCPDLHPASGQAGSVNSEVSRPGGFDVNNTVEMEVPVTVRQLAADHELASEDEEYGGGGRVRKKLRLSKEQAAFLEDSFKENSTLTLAQKSKLAHRLSLRPRQVEVWFQNRRARTKLKQTEVECEYLKRFCETLTQENRRLRKEVAELRRAFPPTYNPFYNNYHHFPAVIDAYSPAPIGATHATIAATVPPPSTTSTLCSTASRMRSRQMWL